MESAYVRSTLDVLSHFQVTETHGLDDERVKQQQQKFGKNGTRHTHSLCAGAPG